VARRAVVVARAPTANGEMPTEHGGKPSVGSYILRRGVDGVITIWMVTLLIFLLLRITGNPIEILVPPDTLPEDRARLKVLYGLDKPLWQ
jgi:hypothetical protein